MILDLFIFVLFILLFCKSYISLSLYEIFNILLIILLIVKLLLNIKNKSKKITVKDGIILIIDIVLFLFMLLFVVMNLLKDHTTNIRLLLNIIPSRRIYGYLALLLSGVYLFVHYKKTNLFIDFILLILGIVSFNNLDIMNGLIGNYLYGIYPGNILLNMLYHIFIVFGVYALIDIIYFMFKRIKKD